MISILSFLIGINIMAIEGLTSESFYSQYYRDGKNESKVCTYNYDTEPLSLRKPAYPIHPMIVARRSLKEMTGEPITDKELFNLFEAMRWGPSNFNNQPWRLVYAMRNTTRFEEFVTILKPGNAKWAKDASVLIIMVTDMFNRYKGNKTLLITNSFASGAAFMAMALETSARGYVVHSMAGFERDKAAQVLNIQNNKDFNVEVMIAIGKRPPLNQRKFPEKTSERKSIQENVFQDVFNEKWLL